MSYLVLILSVWFGFCAVATTVTALLAAVLEAYLLKKFKFHLGTPMWHAIISFALVCLAIYINRWPLR